MKIINPQLYLQVFHKFSQLDSDTIDRYQRKSIMVIIFVLLVWMLFVITRPLDEKEHNDLLHLAKQSHYELTRQMAVELLDQKSTVNRYQYFRVLRALHAERHHILIQEDIVKPMPKVVDRLLEE